MDSEVILGLLKKKGYQVTTELKKADAVILNTCAFIEDAKTESIDYIIEFIRLKNEGLINKLIVLGCLAQRYPVELENELPEIDALIAFDNYPKLPEAVEAVLANERIVWPAKSNTFLYNESMPRLMLTPGHYAYIKIAEGCNHSCTFCVVPKIKGRFRSRKIEDIIDEASRLKSRGVKEMILVGQDTTAYGTDTYGKLMLPELIRAIDKDIKPRWLRLLYGHPDYISDELIEVFSQLDSLCKYVDIPLQHISGRVLAAMGRPSASGRIEQIIDEIRKKIPGVFIRTSFIVGFPGESREEFRQLCDFVKKMQFERLGVFRYSREEDTAAYHLDKQVTEAQKQARFDELMLLQQEISKKINKNFINRKIDVIIDGVDEGRRSRYIGRSRYDAPEVDGLVYVDSNNELKPGDIVEVNIENCMEYDLAGRAVDEKNS